MKKCRVMLCGMVILMALSGIIPALAQDSLNVTMVGSLDITAHSVAVSGNYAYVGSSYMYAGGIEYPGNLNVVNVANPANPTWMGNCTMPNMQLNAVAVSGYYAYVATYVNGLRVVNVSNPANPLELNVLQGVGMADVAVSGNYAYVAATTGGLRVVNVSNPSYPVEVGSYSTTPSGIPILATCVAVSGNYAYLGDAFTDSLRVINVADPAHPTEIGRCALPAQPSGVAVSGNYAYVADALWGLWVVDVSNPQSPVEVGYYNTPGTAWGVAVSGRYAYVADYDAGLRVVDVSNPANPYEVGYYNTPYSCYDVAVSGNYAYVADLFRFEIFDCSAALPVPNSESVDIPRSYSLLPAYPNPFNSATRLSYSVAAAGRVQLVIYDLLGRQVGMLVDRTLASGNYSMTWDAGNLASGIYFCRMEAGGFQQVRKLTLLK